MLQNTMKFSNYSELGCLLKKVGQAIQDYLGKKFFKPFSMDIPFNRISCYR